MDKAEKGFFPRWLFAILAISGLLVSGIYIGIISLEGLTIIRFFQAVGFGIFGLLMFWGAFSKRS